MSTSTAQKSMHIYRMQQGAHGVVVSHPLRMRKALGSKPSVSNFQRRSGAYSRNLCSMCRPRACNVVLPYKHPMLVARAHSRHAHFAAAVTARTLAGTVTQKIGAWLEDRVPHFSHAGGLGSNPCGSHGCSSNPRWRRAAENCRKAWRSDSCFTCRSLVFESAWFTRSRLANTANTA